MHQRVSGGRRSMIVSSVSLILSSFMFGTAAQADPPGHSPRSAATASPIKHVIIIVGENRSFDHIFATNQPKRHSEKVLTCSRKASSRPTARRGRILPRGTSSS